jgi:branched-chain amino acid transport system substrate-binding protein
MSTNHDRSLLGAFATIVQHVSKSMTKGTTMRYPSLLFVITIALACSRPGFADDVPGVTDDRILVGRIADLTGPVAFIGQQISHGSRLYLQHVNEQGGVHGRQIELREEDDGYQPPRAVAAFRKLVGRDRVFCFVGNLGTATTIATFPLIEREQVPVVMPGTFNSQMATPAKRYVFPLEPNYQIEAWLILQYIANIEQADTPRLAVIYQDDDMGHDGLKGLREAAAHYDMPIVSEQGYKRGGIDFGTQTLNARAADPTHVLLFTVYRGAAAIMREARQTGWQPQFIGWLPNAESKTIELAGEAAEGFLGLGIVDLQSNSEPMRLYRQLHAQHQSNVRAGLFHTYGFGMAQTLVEGLRRAGRDLTREKLVEALETLDHWDGSVFPPVTYGPNVRGGQISAAFMMKADVANQRMVRATDLLHFERPTQGPQHTVGN